MASQSVVETDTSILGKACILVRPALDGLAGVLAIDALNLTVFESRLGGIIVDTNRLVEGECKRNDRLSE